MEDSPLILPDNVRGTDQSKLSKDRKILLQYSSNVETGGVIRNQVENILRLYRETVDISRPGNPNAHQIASSALKTNGVEFLNREKRIGAVPGVKIGDEFEFRFEMVIIGLHLPYVRGIDHMELFDGVSVATSVVAASNNQYENTVNFRGELIYTGEGGNPTDRQPPRDQVLEGGNLALKNSMEWETPVRVIRKLRSSDSEKTADSYVYVYDGLHMVEKYWQERGGTYNKLVFKFQFRRISGQPPRNHRWKNKKESFIILEDLAKGKEKVAIAVVNTIDDEKPSKFTYTPKMEKGIYNSCIGCNCDQGCSDSEEDDQECSCKCKVKNDQTKFRYDYDECMIELETERPYGGYIYECGPSCLCFKSCINRVSQRGIQLKLEVFKTEYKGWGVRSKTEIPCGKFVCEYAGELVRFKLLDDQEKGGGIDDNEYLFIIDQKNTHTDHFGEKEVLAVNAAQKGNVGRFINHSCSPNLHVQYVYIGLQSKAPPHIMLFAMKEIKPFEELTFHYKCKDWNGKVKICKCGSSNCVGKFS